MVVLKLLSASPKVYPTPVPGWIIVQLCTPNKANLKFRKNKVLPLPEVNEGWICCRRAAGFTVLLKKLQHIRESNKGFLYNSQVISIYLLKETVLQDMTPSTRLVLESALSPPVEYQEVTLHVSTYVA